MPDSVVVIGLGEIGLAIATALACHGCRVIGYDSNDDVVAGLRQGRARNLAPTFRLALKNAVGAGALSYDAALRPALENRAYIITVPTPLRDGVFDDRPLMSAIESVQRVALPGDLVVVKSAVPIGTTRSVGSNLPSSGLDLDIAHCPDRSISGRAFEEQFSVPHVVGGIDEKSSRRAAELLGCLGSVIRVGSPKAAEALKLFSNAQRDVTFGLANEFALICEGLGLDIYEISRAGAIDYPRGSLTRPGPVGGQCLAKDTHLLAASVSPADEPGLSLVARTVNRRVITHVARTIADHLEGSDAGSRAVAILGIAFKGVPATDDVRESAGVELMRLLAAGFPGLVFRGWDAVVDANTLASIGFLPTDDILAAAKDASVVVVANDHAEFGRMAVDEVGAVMRKPGLIYDLCGATAPSVQLPAGVSVRRFGVGPARVPSG